MVFNNISTIFQLYHGTPIKIVDINELNAIMIMLYRKKKERNVLCFSDGLWKVARFEGLQSLWNGTLPSLVLASNPSVQFMVYEAIKRYFQSILKTKVSCKLE